MDEQIQVISTLQLSTDRAILRKITLAEMGLRYERGRQRHYPQY